MDREPGNEKQPQARRGWKDPAAFPLPQNVQRDLVGDFSIIEMMGLQEAVEALYSEHARIVADYDPAKLRQWLFAQTDDGKAAARREADQAARALVARDVSDRVNLKYRKHQTPGEDVVKRLVSSIKLAREICRAAQAAFEALRGQGPPSSSIKALRARTVELADLPKLGNLFVSTGGGGTDLTARILERHFRVGGLLSRSAWERAVDRIARNFKLIAQGLEDRMRVADRNFESKPWAQGAILGAMGYVQEKPLGAPPKPWHSFCERDEDGKKILYRHGSIHLDFARFGRPGPIGQKEVTVLGGAHLLIHEASHKFCATKDHAYEHEDEYGALTFLQATDNADSYGYAALSLYAGKILGTDSPELWVVPAKPADDSSDEDQVPDSSLGGFLLPTTFDLPYGDDPGDFAFDEPGSPVEGASEL